jgi:hypothetical protein
MTYHPPYLPHFTAKFRPVAAAVPAVRLSAVR